MEGSFMTGGRPAGHDVLLPLYTYAVGPLLPQQDPSGSQAA